MTANYGDITKQILKTKLQNNCRLLCPNNMGILITLMELGATVCIPNGELVFRVSCTDIL
ncbi:MAG: hypothetical protein ACLR13_10130 [Acutalibacteraceae bacterium]